MSAISSLPANWLPRIEHLACFSFSQVAFVARSASPGLPPRGRHSIPVCQLAGTLSCRRTRVVSPPHSLGFQPTGRCLPVTSRPLLFQPAGCHLFLSSGFQLVGHHVSQPPRSPTRRMPPLVSATTDRLPLAHRRALHAWRTLLCGHHWHQSYAYASLSLTLPCDIGAFFSVG